MSRKRYAVEGTCYNKWKEKFKMVRSVVDWTSALYFIIPALIFGAMYYRSLWDQIPNWPLYLFGTTFSEWEPQLQEHIAFSVVLFVLYSVTYFRSIRSFLEEADSLFLLQALSLLRSIIIRGIVYSFIRICFTNIVCIALLLPIVIK
ncbi:ABC transporter permease [Ectobacillus funiculus]|uniref:ABC transporter permease n=1 Tax=Ectobacillus funiculus TaxID=137993 RepID=A0ABV5WAI0_9BACI